MVDNSENILVEFDYQNISVIDPNKVIDQDGNVKDRLIKQENLVMYANLECSVLPRTKLAVGVPQSEAIRTISVGKINFLNPGFKEFLDTNWSDEITGKDTVKGLGVNQPAINITKNPDLDDDFYISQTLKSNGEPGAVDNGLLGITDINISYGLDFFPVVNITLEDVKGRALFEAGNSSPYSAFFNLPYPLFYLTIKGYLGKAIRLPLMLQTFNASFDPSSHNFRIQCNFYTYKYTILADVTWGQMMAVPSMYRVKVDTQRTQSTSASDSKRSLETTYSSGGLQKMKELYSEYKAKGLIDDDFPEITILELKTRLEKLITNIEEQFKKTNLNVLNDLDKYFETISDFTKDVYYTLQVSWAKQFCDQKLVFIKNDTQGTIVYQFRKDLIGNVQKQSDALTKLNGLLLKYKSILENNNVVGNDISIPIKTKTFFTPISIKDINIEKTYKKRSGLNLGSPSSEEYQKFRSDLEKEILNGNSLKDYSGLIYFTGPNSFLDEIKKIEEKFLTKRQEVEEGLTNEIREQFQNKNNGLGFQPTMRNVMAVFFAQGEAFLRLLDDVHEKAWSLRNDENRRQAIYNTSVTAQSVDVLPAEPDAPIYPWPQVIGEVLEDGKEKYVLKYPGDEDIAIKLNAYVPEIWPEVQFVEEFLKGFTEKATPVFEDNSTGNFIDKPDRLSFNAIEFTIGNDVYQNTEESKFFYEIYERMYLNSFYSKMNRDSIKQYNINNFISESETLDIVKALGATNPFLTKKIKEYNVTENYEGFLRHISNQGQGVSWQNFIRGEFNTPYIKNDINNSFLFYKGTILDDNKALPNLSLKNEEQSINYFGNTNVKDDFDFTDVYPLTNIDWCNKYLANGESLQSESDIFKTNTTLEYNSPTKLIKNKEVLPITNFNYKDNVFDEVPDTQNLKTFYDNRTIEKQYTTEGDVFYDGYNGELSETQTTSILNTPIFINAIQEGVFNYKYTTNETSPYKTAAYIFLNSLPLSTLRDKYKVYNENGTSTSKGYVLPSLLKFGAIHEVPYAWALRYGSIWHRYKEFKENNIDILDSVWKDTDYIKNYDPFFSATTTQYSVNLDGQQYDIVLNDTTTNKEVINTGFYPNLINDFNFFLQGRSVFSQNNKITGTYNVSGDTLEVLTLNYASLEPGLILSGTSLSLNTEIVSQESGTPGSIGTYTITPTQTEAGQGNFIVTNKQIGGFSSQTIQNALSNNFKLILSNDSIINKPLGFDLLNLTSSLSITPWSSFVYTDDKNSLYLMPSLGNNINQVNNECFNNFGNEVIDVTQNPSIHNGSIRTFWEAPNYGYFDVNNLKKPAPNQYLREIYNNQEEQQNFGLFSDEKNYSTISELLTTFSPEVLDKFEKQFLQFSKSIDEFDSILTPRSQDQETEDTYENFQGLMREMLRIDEQLTNNSGTPLVNELKEKQKEKIKKTLQNFFDYTVVFKQGNPSNFDRRLFYSLSNQPVIDPYTFNPYIKNSLPSQNGSITLAQSKQQYPETWTDLETYVGFSEISELEYKDSGSYITDFFIDNNIEFTENNVKLLNPLIKIYATQKLKDPTLNKSKFFTLMDEYILKGEEYINIILDNTFTTTRAKLPNVKITPSSEGVKFKEYDGDLTRYEMWDSFKSINDKWISGADLKTKTLFEDILIVDRASRDVGDKVFVDIFKLQNLISSSNYTNKMLGIIETIFVDNRFKTFILPSYANFYNVQDASKNPTPKPEGTLEFANSLFGTFLNVDYRDTTAKYLGIYAYVPSQHLAMNENVDYRYRDDAFDLRRATDNPLLENQIDKTNWDKSNKVVGFNVDFGPQNQQIFKQLDIAQDPGLPTAESEQVLTQMANTYRNREGATQSASLYNVYRNRSYRCSIDMMGNALIQPTMYFNLRNVPMFSGPYMITKVTHRISNNGFDTFFDGQRQPFYSIPSIDNLLQSLSTKILTTLRERVESQEKIINDRNTTIALKSSIVNKANTTENVLTQNQSCQEKLNTSFTQYTNQTPAQTTITFNNAKQIIANRINANTTLPTLSKNKLLIFIMSTMYIETGKGQKFVSYDHNYAGIRLDINPYGAGATTYFTNTYYCASRGEIKNIPYVSFSSFENFVDFFISKYSGKVSSIQYVENDEEKTIRNFTRAYVISWPTNIEVKTWNELIDQTKEKLEAKVKYVFDYLVI